MHATRVRLAVLLALYGVTGLPPHAALAASPVVIPREAIERSGLVSLAEFLAELPISGSTVGRRYNSGGDGTEAVDLRDLGPERTLVLIDGRRALQDAFGRTDLSTIPLAIVERIEIHPGDSARFGADAVAGVVDVVTRRGVEGAEARAHLGEYSQGDGRVEAYDFVVGAAGERSDVTLVAAYEAFQPVFAGDREVSAVPWFGFGANDTRVGASSTTPFGRFGLGFNGNTLPGGGAGTVTLIPGRPGTSASDFRTFDGLRDGYNFAPENYLASPSQRSSLFASARHSLTDSIDARFVAHAAERRSAQQLAPFPISLGAISAFNNLRFPIAGTSIYNPFGRDVTRAQFRPLVEPRRFTQDVDQVRYELGLDGGFAVFERPWTWSLVARYADREQHDTSRGLYDAARLRRALGPSFRDSGGTPRCGTPDAPIADCIPLNAFGGPDGVTREMYDSVTIVTQDSRSRKHVLFEGTLAGELFALPAGPVLVAMGGSHRRESADEILDALAVSGAVASLQTPETAAGALQADDAWLAATLPLLDESPFAQHLDVDLAVRRIDVARHARTRASVAFRWQPFESLLVSGSRAQVARAPSIAELFTGESDRFPDLYDPCNQSANLSPDVMERCRSGFGGVKPVPPGYESNNAQRRVRTGGNPDLAPELGEATRFGLRWSPTEKGLAVWLEWSQLEIRDLIDPVTLQFVVDECYVRANEAACRHVVRPHGSEPDGSFVGAMNTPRRIEREQLDVGADHSVATRFGDFNWGAAATWLVDHDERPLPDRFADRFADPEPLEAAGLALDRGALFPRWRATASLDWMRGDLGATLALRHRSGLEESCVLPIFFGRGELCSDPGGSARFPDGANRIGSVTYVDLSARWLAPWRAELALGVRNALDRVPPVSQSGVTDSSYPEYDLGGRFWFASYVQRF